jgi:hypothetical protein
MAKPRASWHQYANAVLELLPQTPSIRSKHKSFCDIFRSSRVASVQNISSQEPSFLTRHQQHYPQHQVISSFNAAHRRGDWGIKRPLPPVNDAHIVVNEFDSQERQTPFTFATEKPRFVRRMKEFGLILDLPITDKFRAISQQYRLSWRQLRRPRSPLEHLHPQWNRKVGNETGPRIVTLTSNEFKKFLRSASAKRTELGTARLEEGIIDEQSEVAKQLIQAYLDLPAQKPAYQTHPTAGLAYSAKGAMPTTPTGTHSDTSTVGGGRRQGRLLSNDIIAGSRSTPALVYGIVAKVDEAWKSAANRNEVVALTIKSASVNTFGRLELTMSPLIQTSITGGSGRDSGESV